MLLEQPSTQLIRRQRAKPVADHARGRCRGPGIGMTPIVAQLLGLTRLYLRKLGADRIRLSLAVVASMSPEQDTGRRARRPLVSAAFAIWRF